MNQERPVIAILTAPFGAGHELAAQAIRESLLPSGGEARIFDPFSRLPAGAGQRLVQAYLDLLRYAPDLWRLVYTGTGDLPARDTFQNVLSQGLWLVLGPILEKWMQENRPQVVIATHPFTAALVDAWLTLRRETKGRESHARRHGSCREQDELPFFVVTTDFLPHPFWFYPTVTCYCVATPDSARRLRQAGIPADRIKVTGIPVRKQFMTPPDPEAARDRLGLAGSTTTASTGSEGSTGPATPTDFANRAPLVLVMGGGLGVGRYEHLLRGLLTVKIALHVVVFTGRNPKLHRYLQHFREQFPSSNHRVDILPYTENVADWMAVADLLITKPGGLTLAEGLAVGVPMLLVDPVPGQEEENAEYLAAAGAARRATGRGIRTAVQELLTQPDGRLRLRRAARDLARPDAARRIAQMVAAAVDSRFPCS